MTRQEVSPFPWFDQQAEQATNFYVSIFCPSSDNRSQYLSTLACVSQFTTNETASAESVYLVGIYADALFVTRSCNNISR